MVGVAKFGRHVASPYRFQPPRPSPLTISLARAITPFYMRKYMGVSRVEIAAEDIDKLAALKSQRVMLTPNHPAQDPVVLFELSRRLGMHFCWMAARELFERPLQRWFITRLGVYSIDRGVHDADSMNTTRQLIREGKHWVVLFPEGVNHHLHDTVMPFLPGAARLCLGAIEDLNGARRDSPPVHLVPVALRYHYLADMSPAIEESLDRLEQRLSLPPPGRGMWQERMARIAERVLQINEQHYGVTPESGSNESERLDRLRETVLHRVAEGIGLKLPPPDSPLRNRVRKLLNAANRLTDLSEEHASTYAQELHAMRRERIFRMREELGRLMAFIAVSWDYEISVPTVENFLDVLSILEMDLLGVHRVRGPRAVVVKIGVPLDLRNRYEEFKADPDSASEGIMLEVERAVRSMLNSTAHLMTPLRDT